ncbi:MAG TPA: cupin domain-containing protein [Solirubrobacteraceae bacterium]|nr:cupin domain-containing protein [Solirubrobacteraceae bacterium]
MPPLVVHGYRNAGAAGATFLNCHAPGQGFAGYLRALRDGRGHEFDQQPPPADGGRPPSEASVAGDATVVARPGVRVALLADAEAIALAEVAIGPGIPSPPAHVHRRHAESAYVLEGELAVTAGDRLLRAEAGTWLTVPAGVRHAFAPSGTKRVRFLTLHTPGSGFGGFVRALRDAGADADLELAADRAGHDRERAA